MMVSVHDVAYRLGSALAREAGQQERSAVMGYGLEILLGESLKIFVLFLLSMILGIFPTTILVLVVAVPHRLLSGGAHNTAYYRCFLSTLLVFLTLAWASLALADALPWLARPLALLLAGFGLLLTWLYAPVYPSQKPLNDEQKRLRRAWSVALSAAWLLVLAFLPLPSAYRLALAAGLAWQAFTLVPAGGAFVGMLDRVMVALNPLERR